MYVLLHLAIFLMFIFWQVESSDLISYGLIPEFVGRFPVLVSLSALTENQLVQVNARWNSLLLDLYYLFKHVLGRIMDWKNKRFRACMLLLLWSYHFSCIGRWWLNLPESCAILSFLRGKCWCYFWCSYVDPFFVFSTLLNFFGAFKFNEYHDLLSGCVPNCNLYVVGSYRAQKCPREAIQEDVPNEWCKYFFFIDK